MATHSSIIACRTPWTEEPAYLAFLPFPLVYYRQDNEKPKVENLSSG